MIDLIKLTRFLTTITERPKHEIDRVKIMIHYYLYVCFSLIFLEKNGWLVCNFFLFTFQMRLKAHKLVAKLLSNGDHRVVMCTYSYNASLILGS